MKENLSHMQMNAIAKNPWWAALIGFLLLLPFVLLNAIVVSRLEPFFSILRPGPHTSPQEYFLLFFSLLLFPVAVYVILRPMLQKGTDGRRKIYPINLMVGALVLVVTIILWGSLLVEIVRCDILKIPNCD